MGWSTTLRESLRYLINDFSDPFTYSDAQLNKFLGLSCSLVLVDLKDYSTFINGPYSVNMSAENDDIITPDPVSNSVEGFGTLIVIRAAMLLSSAELKKTGITGGWKITDDKSTIDGTNAVTAAQNTYKMYDKLYNDILKAFKSGVQSLGLAVLSPYVSPNGSFVNGYNYPYNHRSC